MNNKWVVDRKLCNNMVVPYSLEEWPYFKSNRYNYSLFMIFK